MICMLNIDLFKILYIFIFSYTLVVVQVYGYAEVLIKIISFCYQVKLTEMLQISVMSFMQTSASIEISDTVIQSQFQIQLFRYTTVT